MNYSFIEQKGLEAFATIIITLYESLGSKSRVKKIIQSNPSMFKDVLFQNSKNIKLDNLADNFNWSMTVIKSLDFTDYQIIILRTITNQKNIATLADLETEFKKRNIDVTTGSVIGGSLAGITKKCNREKIPTIVTHDLKNKYTYHISDEALNPLESFLASLP